ncbi:MAG: hypothetical protein WBZ11_08555 [Candidatus Sulfotelmatobacter sp.]
MKYALPVILVVVTAGLIFAGLFVTAQAGITLGVAKGSALHTASASTPDQAVNNMLIDVQRRNWDRAYGNISDQNDVLEPAFVQSWSGSNGSLRSFSSLEGFEVRPLHETNDEAQMRVHLEFSTPVGPIEDVRDLHLIRQGDVWKAVWPKIEVPNVPAQVIPVTFLRWDLVTASAGNEWGAKNVDSPHVRIISMNAVDSAEGAVVMGEVTNEDTVPAFVTVNSTLVDAAGNAIDEESSFDKIAHILLPKQVTPYRIDFPGFSLKSVKNVRMSVNATLVPASADPVIGVMNQRIDTDLQGKSVLHGDLLNQGGQTVNIPHVIASFYDNDGKVIWVSDGYVDRALLPQSSEAFAVEIPKSLSSKIHNFHVVVNQYSLNNS